MILTIGLTKEEVKTLQFLSAEIDMIVEQMDEDYANGCLGEKEETYTDWIEVQNLFFKINALIQNQKIIDFESDIEKMMVRISKKMKRDIPKSMLVSPKAIE